MLTKLILPGEKIELQSMEKSILGSASDKKSYISRIYDVLSDDQFEVLMPMEQTKLILLPVDGEYDVCFYTKQGLYQCYVRIADRYKKDNTYILLCETISNLRKHQRREFYRFSCILNMSSRELVEEELSAIEQNKQYIQAGLPLRQSVVVDISGGGIRFVSDYKYENGTLIYLTYNLSSERIQKTYNLVGKILSVKELENRRGTFEHRVQYINIDNQQREEIIRYIFEEERKNRQRKNG